MNNNDKKFMGDLLDQVLRLTTKDRAETHGDFESSYEYLAGLVSLRLRHIILPRAHRQEAPPHFNTQDMLWFMARLKEVRQSFGTFNIDDYVDEIGYIALNALHSSPREKPKKDNIVTLPTKEDE